MDARPPALRLNKTSSNCRLSRLVHPLPNYLKTMTIQELQHQLQAVIDQGKNKPTDKVVFQNWKPQGVLSEVDYLLTAVEPETLTLCWDDGHF
jgi:hypothetical protein